MKSLAPLLAFGLLTASQARPGVVVDLEIRDLGNPSAAAERGRVAVAASLISIEGNLGSRSDRRTGMIYRGDRSELLAVDHERKEVIVIDEATAGAMADRMGGAMKEMEKAMANVPPEQRAMIEQMMKQKMGQMGQAMPSEPIERRQTTRRETVGDVPCLVHELYRGQTKARELCVAEWGRIEGRAELEAAFKDLAGFMKKFMESLQRSPLFAAITSGIAAEEMSLDEGFPVRTTTFENGRPVSSWIVQSIRRESLEASTFEAPDGYRRRTMMER